MASIDNAPSEERAIQEDLLGLKGKSALVIGGGLGMGESTSLFLAKAGCNVAVADIAADRAQRVADLVSNTGRRGYAVVGDALNPAEIPQLIDAAEKALGGLDIMVSIVGQASWYDFLSMTLEQWDLDHHRNLRYFALCSQAAARKMVASGRGGSITAITSVSGIQSAPRHAAYGAAKAGLISLVKTMAVELAQSGVRVNAIAPGMIRTPRSRASSPSEGPDQFDELVKNSLVPFRKGGTPDDIGKAALFLASDLASYVTGQTLCVDGGWTAAFLLGALHT